MTSLKIRRIPRFSENRAATDPNGAAVLIHDGEG
jgi:hypothetical protein